MGLADIVIKQWTIRMPEKLLRWLREKAARETIKEGINISMNMVALTILTKAMKTDKKKRG